MNDYLISREEVLNLIDTAFESGAFDGRYAYENLIDAVQNLIHPLKTDLISRQAAIDAFGLSEKTRKYGGDHSGYNTMMLYEIQDILEDLPSVEPERKSGKWISEQPWCLPKCSICGASCFGLHGFDAIKTPYCPNCGADMREVQDEC